MELHIISFLSLLSFLLPIVYGTSFVPSIGQQWPYSQWTSTEAPGVKPKPTTTQPTTTSAPPPEITVLPPLESEKHLLIVTDPNTGEMIYIPANVFWERFGSFGFNPSNKPKSTTTTTTPKPPPILDSPRNPLICDFYAQNCWLPQERENSITQKPPFQRFPSVRPGGGGGSHIYGFPGFHQGSFPSRVGNGVGSSLPPRRPPRPESMAGNELIPDESTGELETSASTWRQPYYPVRPQYYYQQNQYNPRYTGNFRPSNHIYQPDLSREDSQVYDERHNHRHFFPNTLKRGYAGNRGSGIGGTIIGESIPDSNIETTTLPALIRVTRPSQSKPNAESITEE